MSKEVRTKVRSTMRDEGVVRFGAVVRNKNVGNGKEVVPSTGTGDERGEIAKLKKRMEMMMGKLKGWQRR